MDLARRWIVSPQNTHTEPRLTFPFGSCRPVRTPPPENLAQLRERMFAQPARTTGIERLPGLGFGVRINDGPNYYMLYKDIFVNRYYHFEAQRPDPFILDGGGNIGMSVLYFKHVYPASRIVTFEPDTDVLPYLRENIDRNRIAGVEIVPAALGTRTGPATFRGDGKYGGTLADVSAGVPADGAPTYDVPCVRLRDYLHEPVDFLKLNIEGAEWDVLADSEPLLAGVRELVVEYHHLPGLPRTLHRILELLDRCGFEYLINDFDAETNPGARPPFRLTPNRRYFLLVYARRREG